MLAWEFNEMSRARRRRKTYEFDHLSYEYRYVSTRQNASFYAISPFLRAKYRVKIRAFSRYSRLTRRVVTNLTLVHVRVQGTRYEVTCMQNVHHGFCTTFAPIHSAAISGALLSVMVRLRNREPIKYRYINDRQQQAFSL
jgi:hypothetical protein